ncbi:SDR family NAD(P)-dependent oxidoreductase [Streptomyces sp. NPDC091972]|uniref:SDR family NAD(P)-dependent oxidoreductase n=1 Tax=Streptomyces sp. NPDC091972 TaxID=3366007 RepID=UPI00380A6636
MKRLEGKVALISGTARGQGRAAALRFAAEGALVVGGDVQQDFAFTVRAGLDSVWLTVRAAWAHLIDSRGCVLTPYGVRANCVSPEMIDTDGSPADLLAADHPMRSIARHIPLGRTGTPDDVVDAAVFLASDEASYITGANLVVDGGWSTVPPGAVPEAAS